jgi:hypothetical protein
VLYRTTTGRIGQAKSPILANGNQHGCWPLQGPTSSTSVERDSVLDQGTTGRTGQVKSPVGTSTDVGPCRGLTSGRQMERNGVLGQATIGSTGGSSPILVDRNCVGCQILKGPLRINQQRGHKEGEVTFP